MAHGDIQVNDPSREVGRRDGSLLLGVDAGAFAFPLCEPNLPPRPEHSTKTMLTHTPLARRSRRGSFVSTDTVDARLRLTFGTPPGPVRVPSIARGAFLMPRRTQPEVRYSPGALPLESYTSAVAHRRTVSPTRSAQRHARTEGELAAERYTETSG